MLLKLIKLQFLHSFKLIRNFFLEYQIGNSHVKYILASQVVKILNSGRAETNSNPSRSTRDFFF